MNLQQIQSLIQHGETTTIENKKSMAELDKLGKAISGMLNNKGGHGFIGINDAGKTVGVEVTDSTKKKLTDFCNSFDPYPDIVINYVQIPETNKYIIVFSCNFVKDHIPVAYRGRAYFKTEAGVKLMPSERYKQLLLKQAGLSKAWESMTTDKYSISDLDHEEIIKTIKVGSSEGRIPDDEYTENVNEILANLDLLQNNELTNAAMVLFAKKMPADYSQCFIRMGRFVDETMDVVLDSKQIRGNAFQILNEAQAFIRKHIPITSRYDSTKFERIEEAALPLLAIREALINSICHRDYSDRAGDISVLIFNDYLEIHNIGHLYGGLTIEQLSQRHPSRRRNERIAQVFFARKLIDRWGGGTSRIIRLCNEQNLPKPLFIDDSDGFTIRFFFKEPIGVAATETTPGLELKPRQLKILEILAKNKEPLSLQKIVSELETTTSPRTIGDDLANLKEKGLVNSSGIGRGSKWHLV